MQFKRSHTNDFRVHIHTPSLIGSHGETLISAHPCETVTHLIPCSVVGIQFNDIPCRKCLMLTINCISIFPHFHLNFMLYNFFEYLVLWVREQKQCTGLFILSFYFFFNPLLTYFLLVSSHGLSHLFSYASHNHSSELRSLFLAPQLWPDSLLRRR